MTYAEILATVQGWPADTRELWSERAALIQDGCRVTREESERLAFEQFKNKAPMKQRGLFGGDDAP